MARKDEIQYHDVTLHLDAASDPEAAAKLDQILKKLTQLEKTITQGDQALMADLSRLQQEVDETGTVVDGAVTLINGLSEALREAAGNPEEIERLASQLDAKVNELAQAVDNVPHPDQGLPQG
jgi:ABC-type transporter Mla subunit MlaD